MRPLRLVRSLVVAMLTTASLPAFAAPAQLDALVREVLAKNPSLAADRLRHASLRTASTAEVMWPDPRATVMVDRVPERHGGEMPMIRYQVEQMIHWPGKLGSMRAGAERRAEGAAVAEEVRRLDLVLEVRRGYLMLLRNSQERQLNRASYDLVTTIARAAGARYAAGTGGHHELVRAEVERNSLDVEKMALEGERVSVVAMLNSLRGARVDEAMADPEPFETPGHPVELARALDEALRRRPELREMDAMRREMLAMADLARRERYPDLMVGAWWNQMLGAPDSAGAMVGFALPVVGATRQGRRGDALDTRARSVDRDVEAMRAMIRFEVADATRKVDTAERSLAFLRDVALPRAKENIEVSLAAYATGGVDMLELLESRRALQATARAIIAAQADRETGWAELDRATAKALETKAP